MIIRKSEDSLKTSRPNPGKEKNVQKLYQNRAQ